LINAGVISIAKKILHFEKKFQDFPEWIMQPTPKMSQDQDFKYSENKSL
jgi:hypothetical protein